MEVKCPNWLTRDAAVAMSGSREPARKQRHKINKLPGNCRLGENSV